LLLLINKDLFLHSTIYKENLIIDFKDVPADKKRNPVFLFVPPGFPPARE